jgi:hypothetical protein
MSISLKIECDPGSDITDAFQEAIEFSNRVHMDLTFQFNNVTCFVKPGGSVRQGVAEYSEAIASKSQYKFARCY